MSKINLTVSKKSAVTKNGNAILSLKSAETTFTKTPFGMKKSNKFYLMAVDFEGSANVGDTAEVELDDFKVEMRDIVDEATGDVTSLPWLTLK